MAKYTAVDLDQGIAVYRDGVDLSADDTAGLLNLFSRVLELYTSLLYAVETVHPGESRHETAERYIHNAENRPDISEAQSNG